MRKIDFHLILLVTSLLTFYLPNSLAKLDLEPNSLKGTENLKLGLTDKQLALQKYFSFLTIFQTSNNQSTNSTSKFGWQGWEANYNYSQLYLPSLRYPLSFIGYAVTSLVYKTPAYRELAVRVVDNVIQRLLEEYTYSYIKAHWSHNKHFPDPVVHENIMYSGHLAKLISLYESLSGDLIKYSQTGWYFSWNGQQRRDLYYNSDKLMRVIYDQVEAGESGGVACEPNSVFVVCNNHPRIAFRLYDAIHNTNYSASNLKWEKWLRKHGRAPNVWPNPDYRYFRIIYYAPAHVWIPTYGTSGNDAWALAFLNAWLQDDDKSFARNGYFHMLMSREWRKVDEQQEYLDAGLFGTLSEMNTWLASSLFIAVDAQYSSSGRTNKSLNVLNWFETNFGSVFNPADDNNNKCSSNMYTYKINDTQYQIWTSASVLMGMVASSDLFEEMYNRPFYLQHLDEPELTDVEYPRLHVSYAVYNRTGARLDVVVKTDCGDATNVSFSVRNVDSFQRAVQEVNGLVFDVSANVRRDFSARRLEFSGLVINDDYENLFTIYF